MRTAWLVSIAAAFACSGGGKLSVSTKVADGAGGTTALAAAAPAASALAIGDRVTLERVRILVRKVALEGEGSAGGSAADDAGKALAVAAKADDGSGDSDGESGDAQGEGSGDGDEVVVRWGPLVIDLSGAALDGGVKLQLEASVPAGTYDELKLQIHKLTPGETVADPAFAPLGRSILLDLTVDGKPVTFASDLTAVAEIEGPFKVEEGKSANVTLTIDPSHWFTAKDGSFLDPSVDANRRRIEQNLRASIHGFQDDDRDGDAD